MAPLCLDKEHITIDEVVEVARENVPVQVSPQGEARVARAWDLISHWVREKRVIYGITTGFGALSDVTISTDNIAQRFGCATCPWGMPPAGRTFCTSWWRS
ncbi:Histidine ammonia-lyase (EC [Olavius algarvensis associated proteobacterium Delta 3]|nr:Histidine ammonia-lyase (EC [Olavius algarvensis associated proteobacterium Delta 3]